MEKYKKVKKNDLKNKTHTLIVSDFHLGSKVSRSKAVKRLLESFRFRKLILLGDIFESLDFNRLKNSDWELLSLIGKISRKKKVVWIEGNHDKGLTQVFSALIGAKVYKSYKWRYKNKKYLAIHGHQFDNFLINNAILSVIVNQIYNFIQLIDFRDKRTSRYIKRKSKGWLRLSRKVARRAILYARLRQVNYIFCGHTHKSMKMRRGKTYYYNSGCWTDIPSAYITLDKDNIEIHKVF